MPAWLQKARKKYSAYKAKAPERAREKESKEMSKLRSQTRIAEQKSKLVQTRATVEKYKSQISKSKASRPSLMGGIAAAGKGLKKGYTSGFGFTPPPATDMWGTPTKSTKNTVKKAIKKVRKTKRRVRKKARKALRKY